jgi:hypothetical protein
MKTCKKGLHTYPKDKKQCPKCEKLAKAKWVNRNKEYYLNSLKEWRQSNSENYKADGKLRYAKNKDAYKAASKARYRSNPALHKKQNDIWKALNLNKYKEYMKNYAKVNAGKLTAIARKRQMAKLQRTPKWLTEEHFKQIEKYYLAAKWIELILNEKIHVDHIIPLQGKNVSGLHVPWNLQLLTKLSNCSKGNKHGT